MHRSVPVSNRLIFKKWEERSQAIYLQKLNGLKRRKKSIKSPETIKPKSKPKTYKDKDNFSQEKNIEIVHENEILHNKIALIRNSSPFMANQLRKLSLNKEARISKLKQIDAENEAIYKRLQSKNSTYSSQKCEQDNKPAVIRAMNISEFPYSIGARSRSPSLTKLPVKIKKSCGSLRLKFKKSILPKKLEPLATSGIVVYEKGMNIGNEYFMVVMTSMNNCILINASNAELTEMFLLELAQDQAESLMGGKHKYDILAKLLSINDGKLVVNNHGLTQTQIEKEDEKDEEKLEDDFINARVIKGQKDIVGGYILNYTQSETVYSNSFCDSSQELAENTETKVKEFVFVSSNKNEELVKYLQTKDQKRFGRVNLSIRAYTKNSPTELSRQYSSTSFSTSNRSWSIRKTSQPSTKTKSIALGDFMSQTTGFSSICKQDSDSDSVLSSVGLEDQT